LAWHSPVPIAAWLTPFVSCSGWDTWYVSVDCSRTHWLSALAGRGSVRRSASDALEIIGLLQRLGDDGGRIGGGRDNADRPMSARDSVNVLAPAPLSIGHLAQDGREDHARAVHPRQRLVQADVPPRRSSENFR